MRVFSDFDGTISLHDTTDAVLSRFAGSAWEAIEADWIAGVISAKDCMQRQIGLIRASRAELDAFLDTVDIDPGFGPFARLCQSAGAPLTVVSDGVDYFIRRILTRHGLGHLQIIANALSQGSDRQWRLSPATSAIDCAAGSGVCKCSVVAPATQVPVVYIGDGRSDFCVVSEANVVYAKSKLALYCEQRGLTFKPFDWFADIVRDLAPQLRESADKHKPHRIVGDRMHA